MDNFKKILLMLFGLAVIVLVVAFGRGLFSGTAGILSRNKSIDYVIPGVPYVGIYSHTGKFGEVSDASSAVSAVASILEYWSPGKNDFSDLGRSLSQGGAGSGQEHRLITGESVRKAAKNLGYEAKSVHLELSELKQYINPDKKTPLYFIQAIDVNQPADTLYHPAGVLIGIKESEKKLVVHDYWQGNNYEISFDDFQKLWEKLRPDERNTYTVIQPTNLDAALGEISKRNIESYPQRTERMKKCSGMFKTYALGHGAKVTGMMDKEMEYFTKVKDDPEFNAYFPDFFKANVYSGIAEALLAKGDVENALNYAQKAVDLDHDLDKPSGDWPGYETSVNSDGAHGQIIGPYVVLGDAYAAKGNIAKAKENYSMAVTINPGDMTSQMKLDAAERL
jgi:tetratricopeptide (TPR) repeat protein